MSKSEQQTQLDTFRAGTTAEPVTRTVVVPLQSSERKREKVREAVEEYRDMASWLSDVIVSLPEHEWSPQNSHIYRMLRREFPKEDRVVASNTMNEVKSDVVGAFDSWVSNGRPGKRPAFRDTSYFAVHNRQLTLVENDGGYGLKVNFIPYDPEWFRLNSRPYHDELLQRVIGGDARLAGSEIHLTDGGITAHLPIRYDVEVYKPDDVSTAVGVDLGENTLFAAAVVDGGNVEAVEMESGREFRHHRDRLSQKQHEFAAKGDLGAVKACKGERERYTDQVCHTAAKQVVELAAEHAPAKIRLEDLTHYRETAPDAIHDWPFRRLQEYIMYKATAAGIPVEKVNPRDTSITCRECRQATPEFRDGHEFHCRRCGYEVHADVNAAINIALVG